MKKCILYFFFIIIFIYQITDFNLIAKDFNLKIKNKSKYIIGIGFGNSNILTKSFLSDISNALAIGFIPFPNKNKPYIWETTANVNTAPSFNFSFSYVISEHIKLKSIIDTSKFNVDLNSVIVKSQPDTNHRSISDEKIANLGKLSFMQFSISMDYYFNLFNRLKLLTGCGIANQFFHYKINDSIKQNITAFNYTKYKLTPILEIGLSYPVNDIFSINTSINYTWQQYSLNGKINNTNLKNTDKKISFHDNNNSLFYRLNFNWEF